MIALREYGLLVRGEEGRSLTRIGLDGQTFDQLEEAYFDGFRTSPDVPTPESFLSPTRADGRKAFKVANWVGVLCVGEARIEVLPKTARDVGPGRQLLLNMLRLTQADNFKPYETHGFAPERMPLYEIFIRVFLDHALHVVKRGIRRDYVEREENRECFKGRLLVAQNLRLNRGMHHRVYTAADEFIEDRPANRLLKTAIEHVRRKSTQMDTQRLARELLFAFQDVPVSRNPDADLRKLRLDRMMQHYRPALTWARWLLKGLSPFDREGETDAPSLLFPMQDLFEDYLGWLLARVPQLTGLRLQPARYWLMTDPKRFNMRPDFEFFFQERRVIGDAKWKQADQDAEDGKYGVSQADLYQLYAYGHKYLRGSGQLFLFYPKTKNFRMRQDLRYEDELRLSLVPVRLPEHADDWQRPTKLAHELGRELAAAMEGMK